MGCLPYRHFQKSKTFRTSSCRSTDSRVGSFTADWEVLAHGQLLRGPSRTGIQRIEREDEPRRVSLEVMLRGTCDGTRLLDLVEKARKNGHIEIKLPEDSGLEKVTIERNTTEVVATRVISLDTQPKKRTHPQ